MHQLAAGPRPVVILLDMMMPRMDGEAFLLAVRSRPSLAEIPVVVITGHSDAARRVAGLDTQGCLHKPIGFDDLRETVNRFAASACVATDERGSQFHRRHRCPGTHPVGPGRFSARAA